MFLVTDKVTTEKKLEKLYDNFIFGVFIGLNNKNTKNVFNSLHKRLSCTIGIVKYICVYTIYLHVNAVSDFHGRNVLRVLCIIFAYYVDAP